MNTWLSRTFPRQRQTWNVFVICGYFFAILYALLIVLPLYFVLISAFKNNDQIITTPLALPSALLFKKFIQAQSNVNLLRAMVISAVVTTGAELLTLALAFPAAYAIARIQTRLAAIAEAIFSLGFLIPGLAILMPIYLMTAKVGLLYHPIALIILYPAFNLPLSIVLNFINIWNEYLFALILMDSNNRTIQLALALLRANQRSVDYGLIAAGVVISMIPVYVTFIFFQDKIMSGMLAGAIKE